MIRTSKRKIDAKISVGANRKKRKEKKKENEIKSELATLRSGIYSTMRFNQAD